MFFRIKFTGAGIMEMMQCKNLLLCDCLGVCVLQLQWHDARTCFMGVSFVATQSHEMEMCTAPTSGADESS